MGLVYHLSYFIIVDKFWKKIKENDERWNEFEFDGGVVTMMVCFGESAKPSDTTKKKRIYDLQGKT